MVISTIEFGNNNARLSNKTSAAVVTGGLVRIVAGAGLAISDLVLERRIRARSFNMFGHGVGLVGHLIGLDVRPYARSRA